MSQHPYRGQKKSSRVQAPIDHSGLAVWTDGACSGNPGPGGFGWLEVRDGVPTGLTGSDGESRTTNQRMEVAAVLDALRTVTERPLVVYSDSTYVVDCFTKFWWRGWLSRGWTNSQGKPVANRDLWEPLVALVQEQGAGLAFRWVKGHADVEFNEAADKIACGARDAQSGRSSRPAATSGHAPAPAPAKERAAVPDPTDQASHDPTAQQQQAAVTPDLRAWARTYRPQDGWGASAQAWMDLITLIDGARADARGEAVAQERGRLADLLTPRSADNCADDVLARVHAYLSDPSVHAADPEES